MPTTALSKYAENQPLSATGDSYPLMDELLADTLARATNVTAGIGGFSAVIADLTTAAGAWFSGMGVIANAEAGQRSATQLFDAHMDSLVRAPDTETNSEIENWDSLIRSQVPYQSAIYTLLLPEGRDTITAPPRERQLLALNAFSDRLTAQVGKPVLVALGATVDAFETTARGLRTAQTDAKSDLDAARQGQENLRIAAAESIYAVLGQGMVLWSADSSRVDTLWDVNILRNPPQEVPAAPLDTTWTPATRTLSTSALPPGATRLEAWRVGPGSMPELLLTAGPGQAEVVVPATITFVPGALYQLWLVALNSKGKSGPGPLQNWTAV